jgi:hypothetical protein
MKNFTFVIKHIYGNANKVVDAFKGSSLILQEFQVNTWGLNTLRKCIMMIQISEKYIVGPRPSFEETLVGFDHFLDIDRLVEDGVPMHS